MVAKRHAPFKAKYAVELGLRVKDRDPETNEVTTATCLFCQLFGREGREGALRRATDKVAVFKLPFRKDSILVHHTRQHPAKWTEYCALSSDDSKRAFFIAAGATIELSPVSSNQEEDTRRPRKTQRTSSSTTVVTPSTSTSDRSSSRILFQDSQPMTTSSEVHWLVNRDIVTVLVGVLLPYAASSVPAGQTYQLHAVADFEDMVNVAEMGGITDMLVARYRVVVKDPTQFQQFIDLLSTSGSLKNTGRMLYACSHPTANPFIVSGSHEEPNYVAKYARYLCAINFQRMTEIAKSAGAYSIGLKISPIAPASFFEAQVEYCLHMQLRVFVDGEVNCFHVLSIPLNKRRRSDVDGSSGVFEIAENALNAIVPRWQDLMLAVITDSDGITAQDSNDPRLSLRNAVASRFASVAKPGFLRVSCAARQLDALMQKFFTRIIGSDEMYANLTAFIAYLNRQRVLLVTMKTGAPNIGDNRWRSLANIAQWFRRHGASIRGHFELQQPAYAPSVSWWIRILLAARIGLEFIPVLDEISVLSSTTSPREGVDRLRTHLANWFNISGPLEIDDAAVAVAASQSNNENLVSSSDAKYSISINDACKALEDLGSFIADTLQTTRNEDEISQSVLNTTVNEIASCVVNLVAGLHAITIDIDGISTVHSELSPVVPRELVKLRGQQFAAVIRPQMDRLRLAGWSRQEIDWIEQDFQDLCGAYFREPSLQAALESGNSKASFRDSWSCLQGRFTCLQRFCGTMATAYPTGGISNDVTGISSNSSLQIGCSSMAPTTRATSLPGDLESGVLDLSVQAALQARQFRRLQSVKL